MSEKSNEDKGWCGVCGGKGRVGGFLGFWTRPCPVCAAADQVGKRKHRPPDADTILARKIKRLLSKLEWPDKLDRRAAAEDLRLIARQCPEKIVHQWQEIRRIVETPHDDSTVQGHMDYDGCGEHSDYEEDTHTDNGIGLGFPKKPPKSAKRDF